MQTDRSPRDLPRSRSSSPERSPSRTSTLAGDGGFDEQSRRLRPGGDGEADLRPRSRASSPRGERNAERDAGPIDMRVVHLPMPAPIIYPPEETSETTLPAPTQTTVMPGLGQTLLDGTYDGLERYTQANADWNRTVEHAAQNDLYNVLRVIRGWQAQAAFSHMKVSDLAVALQSDEQLLLDYARAVCGYSVPLHPEHDVPSAKMWGGYVRRFEQALPCYSPDQMPTIFEHASLPSLVHGGRFDAFERYLQICAPDGIGKRDIDSFMRHDDRLMTFAAKPFAAQLHNVHRLSCDVLELLETHHAIAQPLPVALVVHSGHDASGAFHHNVALAAALHKLAETGHRVVMVEGKGLADAAGFVASIRGKVSKVLICGHGAPTSIDMAPTPAQQGADHNLVADSGGGASDAFLQALADKLDTNPVVLLEACLTNATDPQVPEGGGDVASVKEDMRAQMRSNPSLVDALQAKLNRLAPHKNNRVLGPHAAISQRASLWSTSQGMTLQDPNDPMLLASKDEYAAQGKEMMGVWRSLLSVWASDRSPKHMSVRGIIRNRLKLRIDAGSFSADVLLAQFELLAKNDFALLDDPGALQQMSRYANALNCLSTGMESSVGTIRACGMAPGGVAFDDHVTVMLAHAIGSPYRVMATNLVANHGHFQDFVDALGDENLSVMGPKLSFAADLLSGSDVVKLLNGPATKQGIALASGLMFSGDADAAQRHHAAEWLQSLMPSGHIEAGGYPLESSLARFGGSHGLIAQVRAELGHAAATPPNNLTTDDALGGPPNQRVTSIAQGLFLPAGLSLYVSPEESIPSNAIIGDDTWAAIGETPEWYVVAVPHMATVRYVQKAQLTDMIAARGATS